MFFHLRNGFKMSLTFDDLQSVIHVFITSHLVDYNDMFARLSQNMIAQLRGVQNAADTLQDIPEARSHLSYLGFHSLAPCLFWN